MVNRSIRCEIRYSLTEGYFLEQLCNEYNVNLSTLFRECMFTDFSEQRIVLNIDDIFIYSNLVNKIIQSSELIIGKNIIENLYTSELEKIKIVLEDIKIDYIFNFKRIKASRTKIKNEILKIINKEPSSYSNSYINKELEKTEKENLNRTAVILLTPDEKEQLKKIAEEQGVSLSTCLKNNVFRKCGAKRIVVDSYSINKENEELNSKANILAAIADKAKNDFLSQRDIENALLIIEDISEINNKISQIVITDDELKAEVKRLLTERSEQNGSNKD